jgi:hypothetical protein
MGSHLDARFREIKRSGAKSAEIAGGKSEVLRILISNFNLEVSDPPP